MWQLCEGLTCSEACLVEMLLNMGITGVWFINRVEDSSGVVLARKVQGKE
jgi:hypothetical protein